MISLKRVLAWALLCAAFVCWTEAVDDSSFYLSAKSINFDTDGLYTKTVSWNDNTYIEGKFKFETNGLVNKVGIGSLLHFENEQNSQSEVNPIALNVSYGFHRILIAVSKTHGFPFIGNPHFDNLVENQEYPFTMNITQNNGNITINGGIIYHGVVDAHSTSSKKQILCVGLSGVKITDFKYISSNNIITREFVSSIMPDHNDDSQVKQEETRYLLFNRFRQMNSSQVNEWIDLSTNEITKKGIKKIKNENMDGLDVLSLTSGNNFNKFMNHSKLSKDDGKKFKDYVDALIAQIDEELKPNVGHGTVESLNDESIKNILFWNKDDVSTVFSTQKYHRMTDAGIEYIRTNLSLTGTDLLLMCNNEHAYGTFYFSNAKPFLSSTDNSKFESSVETVCTQNNQFKQKQIDTSRFDECTFNAKYQPSVGAIIDTADIDAYWKMVLKLQLDKILYDYSSSFWSNDDTKLGSGNVLQFGSFSIDVERPNKKNKRGVLVFKGDGFDTVRFSGKTNEIITIETLVTPNRTQIALNNELWYDVSSPMHSIITNEDIYMSSPNRPSAENVYIYEFSYFSSSNIINNGKFDYPYILCLNGKSERNNLNGVWEPIGKFNDHNLFRKSYLPGINGYQYAYLFYYQQSWRIYKNIYNTSNIHASDKWYAMCSLDTYDVTKCNHKFITHQNNQYVQIQLSFKNLQCPWNYKNYDESSDDDSTDDYDYDNYDSDIIEYEYPPTTTYLDDVSDDEQDIAQEQTTTFNWDGLIRILVVVALVIVAIGACLFGGRVCQFFQNIKESEQERLIPPPIPFHREGDYTTPAEGPHTTQY